MLAGPFAVFLASPASEAAGTIDAEASSGLPTAALTEAPEPSSACSVYTNGNAEEADAESESISASIFTSTAIWSIKQKLAPHLTTYVAGATLEERSPAPLLDHLSQRPDDPDTAARQFLSNYLYSPGARHTIGLLWGQYGLAARRLRPLGFQPGPALPIESALFILIVLLARTHPKQTASFVFTDFVNQTGWKSNGVVFFIGLLPGVSSVNGFAWVAHLADEVPEPKKNIPRVKMGSALLSTLAGIPMILVMMFCIMSPDDLLAPIGNQPVAQLLMDSLDSEALTIIGILVYTICMFAAGICTLTAFSRVLWSTSRLGCFPFSGFMAKVNTHNGLPINAIVVGFLLVVGLGAIELGSSTATNAIICGGIVLLYTSYEIFLLTLAWKGRSNVFPKERYFNTVALALSLISYMSVSYL